MNFKNNQPVDEILSTGLKKCNKCQVIKSLGDFYKDKSKRDGYTTFCKECKNISCKLWTKNNPEKNKIYKKRSNQTQNVKLSKKKYIENNKEKIKECQQKYIESSHGKLKRRTYIENNIEKIKEYKKSWEQKNPEKVKLSRSKYKRNNKGKINYLTNKRRRRTRLQTPIWANQELIRNFYINCPLGYEVDHIIPLCGETVSGLHTIENLQYLPAKENRKKSNKLIESYLNIETDNTIIIS